MKEKTDAANGTQIFELNEGFCFVIANNDKNRFVGFSKSYGEYAWMADVQDAKQFKGVEEAGKFLETQPGFFDRGCIVRLDVKTVYTITASK